jgi:hypothetical protein
MIEPHLNDKPPCLPFRRTRELPKIKYDHGDNQINFICKDNAVTAPDHWRKPGTIRLSREIILSANVCDR